MPHFEASTIGSNDVDHMLLPCKREIVEWFAPVSCEVSNPTTLQTLSHSLELKVVELDWIFLSHGNQTRLFIERPNGEAYSIHSFFSDRGVFIKRPVATETRILAGTKKSVSSTHLMDWLEEIGVDLVYILNYGGKIPLYYYVNEGESETVKPGLYYSKTIRNLDEKVQSTGERCLDFGLTVRTKQELGPNEPAINLIIPPSEQFNDSCEDPRVPDVYPLFHHFQQMKDIPCTPGGFTFTGNRLARANAKIKETGITVTKITAYTGTFGTTVKDLASKEHLATDISWSEITRVSYRAFLKSWLQSAGDILESLPRIDTETLR